MLVLDRCSTETIFIENYEIQISISVFTHLQVYLFRVSFLTTLNIYKDNFKGRQNEARLYNLMKSHCACKL